jgi:hypothetical protein
VIRVDIARFHVFKPHFPVAMIARRVQQRVARKVGGLAERLVVQQLGRADGREAFLEERHRLHIRAR